MSNATVLNISRFFNEAAPRDYSASIAEIGQTAGADTWRAAIEDSEEYLLLETPEQRAQFRCYIRGFGAWDKEEIDSWTNTELNALCIQMVSGDLREANLTPESGPDDWERYERRATRGEIAGNIYRNDKGEVCYYIGE